MGKPKRKTPEQKVTRLARKLLPEVVAKRGGLVLASVQNHTEADQRHMVRSQERETVRKLTRIEKLLRAGTIDSDEAAACEWYAEAYSLGYETLGVTANYGGAGGGGDAAYTHLARYRAQQEAREDYLFARAGVPDFLLSLFEGVVLAGQSIGESAGASGRALSAQTSLFRLAANKLHGRISHLLPVT